MQPLLNSMRPIVAISDKYAQYSLNNFNLDEIYLRLMQN